MSFYYNNITSVVSGCKSSGVLSEEPLFRLCENVNDEENIMVSITIIGLGMVLFYCMDAINFHL